jgi:hypothetical protein
MTPDEWLTLAIGGLYGLIAPRVGFAWLLFWFGLRLAVQNG